jgi:membrane-bound lytic murein transglycosylase D
MWFRIAACAVASALWISSAAAQRSPGVQAQPPMEPASLELSQARDGRRAVRGCPIGQDCVPLHQQLHLIELEMFPPDGEGPWREGDERSASAAARDTSMPLPSVRKPSELRADLAWLDDLEMPDLPVRWTPKLVEYLQFYKDDPRGRNIMRGWLVAAGRYRDLIVPKLAAANLPLDLFYVAMIESSFDPRESSSAGAAGLWQFMPAGGRIYGLAQTHWVDERRDPVRATAAAIDYWRDLYQRFGDWNLAMAAFNAGYGAILRSIARYNTNDYWQLCLYENALAWEASLYVPKALAVAIVGHNLEAFGFASVKPEAPEPVEEVTVPVSMSLSTVARAAGTTSEKIKKLNPQLRRNRTPPDARNYVMRVPRGAKPDFSRRLAELQSEWDGYDAYVVAYGERFEDVAATFGLSKRKLRELNELADDSETGGGSVLVVPRVAAEQRAKNRAAARAALHESGVDQQPGEALLVALPDKSFAIAGKKRAFYRVVIGDTLTGVAKALGVKAAELARWNGLDAEANLHPRMVLVAWLAKGFDAEKKKIALLDEHKLTIVTRGSPEHLDLIEARVGRERVRYVAKKPESFEAIAKKFGLKAADLARVNHLPSKTVLKPGEEIVVYRVIDRERSERAAEQWKKMPKGNRGKAVGGAEKAVGVTGRVGREAEAVEVGTASADEEDETADGEGEDAREEREDAREERDGDEPAKKEPSSRSKGADQKPQAQKSQKAAPKKTEKAEPKKTEKTEPKKAEAKKIAAQDAMPPEEREEPTKGREPASGDDSAPVTSPAQMN